MKDCKALFPFLSHAISPFSKSSPANFGPLEVGRGLIEALRRRAAPLRAGCWHAQAASRRLKPRSIYITSILCLFISGYGSFIFKNLLYHI